MTAGPPLVLLPGLLCDASLWEAQRRALADRVETTVADLTGQDTIAGMAQAVLDAAPGRFALAGLSMGGYVAFEILRQAPDRVARVALLDTSARPDTDQQRRRRSGLLALARQGRFKGVTPRLLPLLVHPDRLDDAILPGTIMDMAERVGRDAFLRQQAAILGRPDSRPGLSDIRCPTLVLCGAEDALTPPDLSREIAAAIDGATLTVVKECGHLSPLERPEAVTDALTLFLSRA